MPLQDKLQRFEGSPFTAAAALAAVAAVCATQLSARSTWGDEICSLYAAALPGLGETWKYLVNDVHPPLYFLLLKAWVALFGDSLEAARALSIVFVVGGLAVVYLTARRFLTAAAGLWAAVFFGLTPFLIYHSVHARMYGLLFLFAALVVYAGLAAHKSGRPRDFVLLALAGAGTLYTQYVGVFLFAGVLAAGAVLSLRKRREFFGWVASGAAIAALFAPWVPVFLRQTATATITEGTARFTFQPHHLKYFAKIASPFDHSHWLPLVIIGGAAASALVLGGGWAASRGDRRSSGRWIILATVFGIGLFIAAATVKPLVVTRTMIWFLPGFALLAGVAMASLPAAGRAALAAALIVVWSLLLPNLNLYRRHTDWRAAINYLAQNFQPEDVLVLGRSITYCETVTINYYLQRSSARASIVSGRSMFQPRASEPLLPPLPPDARRRWFILEPSERPSAGLHQSLQDTGLVMQDRLTWFEVGLTRYDPAERTLRRDETGALLVGSGP